MIHEETAKSLAGGEEPWIFMVKQATAVDRCNTEFFRYLYSIMEVEVPKRTIGTTPKSNSGSTRTAPTMGAVLRAALPLCLLLNR